MKQLEVNILEKTRGEENFLNWAIFFKYRTEIKKQEVLDSKGR